MIRTTPFTSFEHFQGSFPYTSGAAPQAPSVRAERPPPVTAPAPGVWGWTKAALPPHVMGTWQSTALTPQGSLTYGVPTAGGS